MNPDDQIPPPGLNRLLRDSDDAARTVAQSARHSSIVRRLRLILPFLAIVLVVIMLAWSDMDGPVEPQRREDVSPQTVGRNELINPKFQSEDTKQQPYTITADKAFQDADNLDLVLLDHPVADLSTKNGASIAMKAKDGEFLQSSQHLKMKGDVRVVHDKGYELQTDQVDIDVGAQTATSQSPVNGHGPAGTIRSNGMVADGKNGIIVFTGPAHLTINPSTTPPQGGIR